MVDRIRLLCKKNNTTLAQLERELGIGNGVIARWNAQHVSYEKIKMVAEYFGVTPEYLMTGEESEPPTDAETAEVLRLLRQASGAKKRAAIAAAIAVLKTKDD